jgi:cytochrome P450
MKREITRVIDITKGTIVEDGRLPRTIFESLLESNLPEKEKSFDRLWQESLLVVGAGADTTANVCAQLTFHLLSNPDKLAKLKEELEEALPDPYEPVKLTVVEHLPYLVGRSPSFVQDVLRQLLILRELVRCHSGSHKVRISHMPCDNQAHSRHRMAYGVATRIQRVAPDEDMQYHQYSIPRGVSAPPVQQNTPN